MDMDGIITIYLLCGISNNGLCSRMYGEDQGGRRHVMYFLCSYVPRS